MAGQLMGQEKPKSILTHLYHWAHYGQQAEWTDAFNMRGKTLLALCLDNEALEALRRLQERIGDWALPVQWFDDAILGIPLVTVPKQDVRLGADFDLLISAIDPLAITFMGLGAEATGGSMILHAAVDDLGGLCQGWHEDLSDGLGQQPEQGFQPRVPLGRVAADAEAAAQWQQVFQAIGQAPFGGGSCDALGLFHRDCYGRWSVGQRWQLVPSA